MNEELTKAYVDLLTSMFTLHRVIKADPAHAAKVELQNHHARMIGQAIADHGGPQAIQFRYSRSMMSCPAASE